MSMHVMVDARLSFSIVCVHDVASIHLPAHVDSALLEVRDSDFACVRRYNIPVLCCVVCVSKAKCKCRHELGDVKCCHVR